MPVVTVKREHAVSDIVRRLVQLSDIVVVVTRMQMLLVLIRYLFALVRNVVWFRGVTVIYKTEVMGEEMWLI